MIRARGYCGALRSRIQSRTRFSAGMSSESALAPAPIAALMLRSATLSLLPSQCSCIPSRGRWFQIDGRSEVPTVSPVEMPTMTL